MMMRNDPLAFRLLGITQLYQHNLIQFVDMMKIGFVGVGNMGHHMARNLLKYGHSVTAFDVSAAAMESLEPFGGKSCASPAHAAEGADAIVTMLPSNAHVRDAYKQALPAISPGTLCIDSSTIDPVVAREIGELVMNERQSLFVDAPVSGGVGGAEKGTLTFMVGGSIKSFNAVNPLLTCMGRNIVHCGDIGTGQTAKLCNNMIVGVTMLGVSEAMNLGVKLGMDRNKLAGIFNTSTSRCWSSDTYNPCPGVMEGK